MRYLIAPLDLTTEQFEIYRLLYCKVDFDTMIVKYTLDQLVNDSNSKLSITKKKCSLIIKQFIRDSLLQIERKGSKGNPTIYKIIKLDEIEKHKRNLKETQEKPKRNTNETNKTSDTNDCEGLEKLKRNTNETQKELKGNTKVTPINEKKKKKKSIYSDEFESVWKLFLKIGRAKNKKTGFKNYNLNLDKYTDEEILKAAEYYIENEVPKIQEDKWIKTGEYFLSPDYVERYIYKAKNFDDVKEHNVNSWAGIES